ncbi:hypothetical protein EAF04_001353 [Stromatinia cepivora]|nr:hypothetical protein EAF04_001353 [Stromatinia cepivora]
MANTTGYKIIRNAISLPLVQQAADLIPGDLVVIVEREKFTEFKIPKISLDIRDEFIRAYGECSDLAELLETSKIPPPKPTNIGIFHPTKPVSTKKKTGLKGEVYATVALTDLSPATGLFIFLAGSHKHTLEGNSNDEWKECYLDLKAGDAIIWRGDLSYLHSSGGGGKFQTLVFVG